MKEKLARWISDWLDFSAVF